MFYLCNACVVRYPGIQLSAFLAGIHITTFLLAIYCLFKEFMKSRYTVLLILAAFLTIDLVCVDEVFSMSRLQWTLPQEFGLYTQFLCALF